MAKVFLGGTCNGSTWRERLIDRLKIDYFNPVVPVWDDAARQKEAAEYALCDLKLYVLTPLMKGVYSIAEVVRDSMRAPKQTILCVLFEDEGEAFDDDQARSIQAVAELVASAGAKVFYDLDRLATHLNGYYVDQSAYSPYIVECLIDRGGGVTELNMEGMRYRFEKNAQGHYVCLVQRDSHREHLCKLPDFRIYQSEKLPEPEFTKDERDFMAEWRTMDLDSFRQYINGRYQRFNASRLKIRRIALEKWNALQSRLKVKQGFPVDMSDDEAEEPQTANEQPPQTVPDESASWTDGQWADWSNLWLRLNPERFERFVSENEDKLLNCPDELWDKAKEKWAKLIAKPWPIDPEGDE